MPLIESLKEHVLTLEISSPQRRNTLDAALLAELSEAFEKASREPDIRAVLLAAQPGIFSAGADLAEELKDPPEQSSQPHANGSQLSPQARMIASLASCTKPVAACVEGPAVGLAVTMLYYCDLVYASPRALFSIPSTALGLTPRFGTVFLALSQGGCHKAAEKILLSEPISAQEALEMRLLSGIYPEEEVRRQTEARVERLARLSPAAVQAAKALLVQAREAPLSESWRREEQTYAALRRSPEAKEACAAFMEGRMPRF